MLKFPLIGYIAYIQYVANCESGSYTSKDEYEFCVFDDIIRIYPVFENTKNPIKLKLC